MSAPYALPDVPSPKLRRGKSQTGQPKRVSSAETASSQRRIAPEDSELSTFSSDSILANTGNHQGGFYSSTLYGGLDSYPPSFSQQQRINGYTEYPKSMLPYQSTTSPVSYSKFSQPQFPPLMMMYSPELARHDSSSSTSPGEAASSAVPLTRKRKTKVEDSAEPLSDSDSPPASNNKTTKQRPSSASDLKKRTKTQRACDSCRSRKIRCDVVFDAEPPLCNHCKQYGFECTFFLPITETRFKKKKIDEKLVEPIPQPKSQDARIYGPTSPMHLLHSTASISSRIYESYDQRWNTTWEIGSTGAGLIKIQDPPIPEGDQKSPAAMSKAIDIRLERDVVEELLNAYFSQVAPLLPVVTQTEFLSSPKPPPILLYSMCLVAAARREVPTNVFDSLRRAVNGLIKSEDVLSTASIANVQALLILCMMGDCHSTFVPDALSSMWIRLGCAIRMAQDLGLHRAESATQNVELRRRVWAACLISDRWVALVFGHPFIIDVHDCDAMLPSCGDPNNVYLDESVRLSILLGRVLKTIYSPSGLSSASDRELHVLLSDLDQWKATLPPHLQFSGMRSSREAGLLHMLYFTVCMIFWRVFMRISYSCPAHLSFALTIEKWNTLIEMSAESIDWLDRNDQIYDVWLLTAYATTAMALVQYHTWARRKDLNAATNLCRLRDTIKRWEDSTTTEHMSVRRKTSEIISLLCEATKRPHEPFEIPALNPTGGVHAKQDPNPSFKQDPKRPGGGVFVLQEKPPADYERLPGVIRGDDEDSQSSVEPGHEDILYQRPSAMPMSMMTRHHNGSRIHHDLTRSDSMAIMSNFGNLPAFSGNMNPTLNGMNGNVIYPNDRGNMQVMDLIDGVQLAAALQPVSQGQTELMEAIPGAMFDYGQWGNFFSMQGQPFETVVRQG